MRVPEAEGDHQRDGAESDRDLRFERAGADATHRAALLALLVTAALLSGCYLRHGSGEVDAGRDAGLALDAGVDAGIDAGIDARAPTCCARWAHERRLTIDAFDERTVTPRLVELRGRPAVVVTGPSDPVGPSGAHLVPLEPDLSAFGAPTSVTRRSFTWGQPASSGERIAVCWGNDDGNVVRVYDADGAPVSDVQVLGSPVESPCIGSAFFDDRFAFAFLARGGPFDRRAVVVVLVDVMTGEPAESLLVGLSDHEPEDASLISTGAGFLLGVLGPTGLLLQAIDSRGRTTSGFFAGPARAIRLVPTTRRDSFLGVLISDRRLGGGRIEGVWNHTLFGLPTFEPRAPPVDILVVEPAPAPVLAAAEGPCREMLFAARGSPDLGVVRDPLRARIESWAAPSTGPLAGDTSVLVMGDVTYVAFASVEPGSLDSVVSVDRWTCVED